MTKHLTNTSPNEWPQASMLRQVALVRDFGDAVATAVELLTCLDCGWREAAVTHDEAITKRLAHENARWPLLWVSTDGTVLSEWSDGTGTTRSPHNTEGFVSKDNMEIVRTSPFWRRSNQPMEAQHG